MNKQAIIKEIEEKAEQFGMSNSQVADNYAGAIPQITSTDKWGEGAEETDAYKRDMKEAEESKQQIINLFKNELGIDADDDTIFEAAVDYANKYSERI